MLIEEAVANRLKTHAGLSALIGASIYPQRLPQGATGLPLPAVTYTKITGPRVHAMVADTTLASPTFQVSCWSSTYKTLIDVAEQVRKALQDFTGVMGGAGGVSVDRAFIENEVDLDFEPDAQVYQRALDFVIWHHE